MSIPNDVFEKAERLARRSRRSRSELYGAALREYVARHAPDEITEKMNEVLDKIDEREQQDPFVSEAARIILERTEC